MVENRSEVDVSICDLLSRGAPVLRALPDPSSREEENHWRRWAGKRTKICKRSNDSDVPSIKAGMWYAGIMALFCKPVILDVCPPGQERISYIVAV